MSPDQIAKARERATEVVNGFRRVADQQARDVVRLADALQQRNTEIARLDAALNCAGTASGGGSAISDLLAKLRPQA
ncbi:hypothetical protein JN531_012625 [Flagellatimonas centrodinii]|uniref:hypothetical protein n=1 Tax=Flagellatimonas centrodinii TaxID=2806210 RepID=UPI001FF03670|nr:hypothetical protein [Flagellatimonas centrodinii]ULQ45944.1 hypothetical protein JN531_012625 [Flagellatimonas centrodinii]